MALLSGRITVLPVSLEVLRSRLKDLDRQENLQLKRMRLQLVQFRKELNVMRNRGNCNEVIKAVIEQFLQGVEADIEAIDAGKKLNELPLSFEEVETSSGFLTDQPMIAEPQAEETPRETQNADTSAPGFFHRLKIWLNTPWSIKWKQIRGDD